MKKKILSTLLMVASIVLLSSCSNEKIKVNPNKETYTVGITQFVRHVALDAATQGFKDSLTNELKAKDRKVKFVETNAQGEVSLCNINATALLSRNVDLILANATAPFQAVVNATKSVPILGTSITSYDSALGINIKDYLIRSNISGTSDLAPLDQQAQMIFDLVDNVKDIGLLYCTAEPNSIYQINKIKDEINKIAKSKNIEVNISEYGFLESNEAEQISRLAASKSDVIYVPTDNVVASCANTIAAATIKGKNGKRTPIIAGEEGICKGTGIATLSISYYDLGELTGKMASKVLLGEENISEMKTRFSEKFTKKYNEQFCKEAGIDINKKLDGYEKIGG